MLELKKAYAEHTAMASRKRIYALEFHCRVCNRTVRIDRKDFSLKVAKETGRDHILFGCKKCKWTHAISKKYFKWHDPADKLPNEVY
jgi:RNase P subunit RPR2